MVVLLPGLVDVTPGGIGIDDDLYTKMKKNGNFNIMNIVSTIVSQVINPIIRLNSKIRKEEES